jgi:putative endonuclease
MSYAMHVLQSLKDGRYYIGSTSDVKKRLESHNSNRTGYTKKFQPWVLIYYEEFETRVEAVRREKYLKTKKNVKRFLEQY